MPKRARSKLAAPAAIISMAQQASPKLAPHELDGAGPLDQALERAGQEIVLEILQAHRASSSFPWHGRTITSGHANRLRRGRSGAGTPIRVGRRGCARARAVPSPASGSPLGVNRRIEWSRARTPAYSSRGRRTRTHRGRGGPRQIGRRTGPGPPARPPVERPVRHQVGEGDEHDHGEHRHLGQPELPQLAVHDRPGVEEDHLDVEDDEDHRDQVEADRERAAG